MRNGRPRATLAVLSVMRVLRDQPGAYGREIMRETGYPSGSVYPVLERLERAGWVASEWEMGDPSYLGRPLCRFYRLTDDGQREAAAMLEQARRRLEL